MGFSIAARLVTLGVLALLAFPLLKPQADARAEKARWSILGLICIIGALMMLSRLGGILR
ncbi:MAG: hypothetical protein ACXVA9_01135 [Bdellovibrionales bacterium]